MKFFRSAKPIFIKDKSLEMNFQAGFVCEFDAEAGKKYALSSTGSTFYRVTLNGKFLHYGPARPPHGYLRVDEITLPTVPGRNILTFEVAGYNCPTFYTLDVVSFLQAEIRCGDEVVAYTGHDFKGISLNSLREQIVPRYSYQRAFTEVWYMDSPAADWQNGDFKGEALEIIDLGGREYLPREFRIPEYKINDRVSFVRSGSFVPNGVTEHRLCRNNTPSADVKCFNYSSCQNDVLTETDVTFRADDSRELSAGRFAEYSFPGIDTGFIRTELTVTEDAVIHVIFSEKRNDEKIDYGSGASDVLNIIKYRLPAGKHALESFECYSFMHVGVMVDSGKIENLKFSVREYCYPVKPLTLKTGDEILDKILHATYEGFRQNTVDCYMDCPGRERGGWLCDSYFTGKTSLLYTGDVSCEKAFLDNFRLAKFPKISDGAPAELPEGLLPMCYPGDNLWTSSIPQWTMWYVMELGEYVKRAESLGIKDAGEPFRELVDKILGFFSGYENSDGLLEKLPYWNFVEWTRANDWVQDVNYPTNMLYSAVLDTVAELYDRPELCEKSAKIRREVLRQSFDGKYFRDHAKRRENGTLEVLSDRSAICQHEAVLFGVADLEKPEFAVLKESIISRFGVNGDSSGLPEDFEPLDLFIGFAIRVLVMQKLGLYRQNLEEIKALYGSMALKTGTIWEHRAGYASLNHGFGGFISTVILDTMRELRK